MSFPLVNDSVVIPDRPDWANPVRWRRNWSTAIGDGVTGSEDRSSSRLTPYQGIDFRRFDHLGLQANREFVARVLQASKKGRAAMPQWHRPQYFVEDYPPVSPLNNPLKILVAGLHRWKWGDYAFFINRAGEWEVVQLAKGTAWDRLVVPAALEYEYASGDEIFPLFFGTLQVNNGQALSDHHGEFNLSIDEPAGESPDIVTGQCPASAPTLFGSASASCAGEIELNLVANDSCPRSYKLSWTPDPFADSYQIETRAVGAGSWNLLSTEVGFEKSVARPYRIGQEYRVRSVVGEDFGDWTAEVTVPAITIEGVMRAVQERYVAAKGFTQSWPDTAQAYPPDGEFDDEIASGGAAKEVELIQAIADVLDIDDFSESYAQVETLEGEIYTYTIPMYSTSVSPFDVLPITVTEGTRQNDLATLAAMLCAMTAIPVDGDTFVIQDRSGSDTVGRFTYGEAVSYASAAWDGTEENPTTWGNSSGLPVVTAYVVNDPPQGNPGPWYVSTFESRRANFRRDFSQYGSGGSAILYFALDAPAGAGSYVPGNNPPVTVDQDFHEELSVSLPQGVYTSSLYGDAKSSDPGNGEKIGWEMLAAQWLIVKSNKPQDGDWQYYP